MYADREESDTHRSVKDRLNGNTADSSSALPRRLSSGKRRREDEDKWEHDLFDTEKPQRSNGRLSGQDLRLKLQKKNTQSMKGSYSGGGGVRDLREKLSGIVNQQTIEPPRQKLKRASEVNKPVRKSFLAETPVSEARKVSSSVTKKKTQQKVDLVDNFLQSLGLEKYSITFQAEEVDMDALIHMTDDDLKAMGIPMGPRKKILLTLESKV